MYPGAHAVLQDLVWPPHAATPRRRRRSPGNRARNPIKVGIDLDEAITSVCMDASLPPATRIDVAARAIVTRLGEMGVRVLSTQEPLTATDLQIAPVADILGVYSEKADDDTLVVVEVKCGSAAGRNVAVSDNNKSATFRVPFDGLRDTWKNRAHAQLALQCACARLWAPRYRRVVGFLACYNPDGEVLKMSPLSKTVDAQLTPMLLEALRDLHRGCWRARGALNEEK